MITIIFWTILAIVSLGAVFLIGFRLQKWMAGFIVGGVIFLAGFLLFYFYLEQTFVKRWGGFMSINVPEGQLHIAATWKEDNLWVENYDPTTNTCIFQEYSRGNMLEGKVVIKNCNPIAR